MFGSVNVLSGIDSKLTASKFTPFDVLATVGISGGLTAHACEQDSFRIVDPYIGQKIIDSVGDKMGWLGDARFLVGTVSALAAHYGANKVGKDGISPMLGSGTVRSLHDLTAGCWTSLACTEVCRSKADEEIAQEGGSLALGLDDGLLADDFGLDDDLMGLDEYADAGSMNFAYGW